MCSAAIRQQIESFLGARIPGALSMRFHHPPELISTGVAEIDVLLQGGIPLSGLAEITGPVSSGRTTLVCSILARATQQGASCAYVDAADVFDPLSAAAIGINLGQLLWVRAGQTHEKTIFKNAGTSADVPCEIAPPTPAQDVYCGGASRHPRMESHGMDVAVEKLFRIGGSLLRDKRIGPGTTNHKLAERVDYTPHCSESIRGRHVEPGSMDRQPTRRGECVLPKGAAAPIPPARSVLRSSSMAKNMAKNRSSKEIWTSLDRALRATDLLLNTGGFRIIVLDMGDVRLEQARRVPLASWYRYRLQAEKTQALFLVLTQVECAKSCASVVLRCKEAQEQWQGAIEKQEGWPLLIGFQYNVSAERKRAALREIGYPFGERPAPAVDTSWKRTTLWAR
jgi:recombination protein RecA